MNEDPVRDHTETGNKLFRLADRVIGLITLIVWVFIIIVLGLLIYYAYLLTQPQEISSGSTSQLRELILALWSQITPYVSQFVKLVTPVFILLFALGVLHRLGSKGASPLEVSKLLADLPSVLALVIIVTICLLPLAGIEVPTVLSNISLVVVGFYFGKREKEARG